MSSLSLFEEYFKKRGEFKDLDLSLSRINRAVEAADVIPEGPRVVHIAGTNGKGSTSFFMAQMLEKLGFSTVLFTSPHIEFIEERIQLSLQPAPRERFDSFFIRSKEYIERYNLSFFETLFLMALMACREYMPDFLILETGLGGQFDATNTDTITLKTPVITSMAQDHQNFLGHKIEGILKEKLAVVKGNSPVFLGWNPDFILQACRRLLPGIEVLPLGAERLQEARRYYPDPFSWNYLNALRVVEYLAGKSLPVERYALPPCRREKIGRVILDGAHNPSGLLSLIKSFDKMPVAALVSGTMERDLAKFCRLLSLHVEKITLTTIPGNERSVTIQQLEKIPYDMDADPLAALNTLLAETTGEVLVTGSLYLCAYLRHFLVKNED